MSFRRLLALFQQQQHRAARSHAFPIPINVSLDVSRVVDAASLALGSVTCWSAGDELLMSIIVIVGGCRRHGSGN